MQNYIQTITGWFTSKGFKFDEYIQICCWLDDAKPVIYDWRSGIPLTPLFKSWKVNKELFFWSCVIYIYSFIFTVMRLKFENIKRNDENSSNTYIFLFFVFLFFCFLQTFRSKKWTYNQWTKTIIIQKRYVWWIIFLINFKNDFMMN